jgi:AraC-like DNA-binding protein
MLRRVLRFRRAVALLDAGHAPADVAARTGYADQPHLSREVRALGGASPARVAAAASVPIPPVAAQLGGVQPGGSVANRSTPVPSGSWTMA